MTPQSHVFSLRLPHELLERLKVRAEQKRRTVTSLVVEAIERMLAEMDHIDEAERRHERATALSDMSDDQFEELLSVIERIRSKGGKRKR